MTTTTVGMRVVPIADIPAQPDPRRRVQVATLEQVRAGLDLGHVVQVVIFCDYCETGLHEADYLADTTELRFATARAWLVENEGWCCDPATGDRCRRCCEEGR